MFPYRNVATGEYDQAGIWNVLVAYWTAVRQTFPQAWGRPPDESRLMHGVGNGDKFEKCCRNERFFPATVAMLAHSFVPVPYTLKRVGQLQYTRHDGDVLQSHELIIAGSAPIPGFAAEML